MKTPTVRVRIVWFELRETRVKLPFGTVGSVTGIAQTLVVGDCGADSSTGLVDTCGGVGCTTVWGSSIAAV